MTEVPEHLLRRAAAAKSKAAVQRGEAPLDENEVVAEMRTGARRAADAASPPPDPVETLEAAIAEASGSVAVDASALTHIDSATLAVLLQCRRSAQARQLGFSVQKAPQRLVDLAKLYGVEELLSLA